MIFSITNVMMADDGVDNTMTKEKQSGKCTCSFLETSLRYAGMYFDPFGKRTVSESKSRKDLVFNIPSSLNTEVYLTLMIIWLIKTIPLYFSEESNRTKLIVACLFILYLWISILGITMTTILPKYLPKILQRIDVVCSETISGSTKHLKKLMILYLVVSPLTIIFAQRSLYMPSENNTVSTADRIRVFPFHLNSTEGQIVAFTYIYTGIVSTNGFLVSACLMGMMCFILGKEFSRITSRIEKLLKRDKNPKNIHIQYRSTNELEALRLHFEKVCDLVREADGFIMYSALIGFFFGVLVFSFSLYCITKGDLGPTDASTSTLLVIASVPQILEYTICGSYLNGKAHAAKDILLQYSVNDLGDTAYKTVSMFLHRLAGPPIGITMFGTFTIDRASSLTVFGTILSYAVLVLQLSPTSPTSNCTTSNGTAV